ncbi:MAG: hypothetical protein SF053_11135 [Bacteroidia bacterium]|nr:hypothetical protein [Bacteroidia bacterium]
MLFLPPLKRAALMGLALMLSSGVWAQASGKLWGPAPADPAEAARIEAEAVNQQKMAHKQAQAPATKSCATCATTKADVWALAAEMRANVQNPAYDMNLSLARLKNNPMVIYPLDTFDPLYPIVIRTGDVHADKQAAKAAEQQWINNRKLQALGLPVEVAQP